jgi:hypothetical protein
MLSKEGNDDCFKVFPVAYLIAIAVLMVSAAVFLKIDIATLKISF